MIIGVLISIVIFIDILLVIMGRRDSFFVGSSFFILLFLVFNLFPKLCSVGFDAFRIENNDIVFFSITPLCKRTLKFSLDDFLYIKRAKGGPWAIFIFKKKQEIPFQLFEPKEFHEIRKKIPLLYLNEKEDI